MHLRNLSSSEIFDDVAPWDFSGFDRVPKNCLGVENKKIRDEWINRPETEYHVYSMFEGVQSNIRIRASKKGGDDNEPRIMRGLVVDYDCPMTPEQVKSKLPKMGEKLPTEFEQTLSGHGRLVWRFQSPIVLPSRSFAIHLLKDAQNFFPLGFFPGLDEGALFGPEKYFTNGGRWTKLQPWAVPTALLRGWVIKLTETFNYNRREFGKAINLKAIEAECRKRYPRFAEWEGDFNYGSQGPTFWVEGSKSPKSAIVKETGCHTFSATAEKAGKCFYTWAEIVGAEFAENTELKTIGAATEGIYWDGKTWFFPDGEGKVRDNPQDATRGILIERGLSPKVPKGENLSEADKALNYIRQNQRIDSAASCAFYPKGIFHYANKKILNMHQIDALTPVPAPQIWGPDGGFPWHSAFLDTFFTEPKQIQLERFLAWLQRYYRSCLDRNPVSGHALFIAGPPNCGKTYLSRAVIAGLVGGFAEPNRYLQQADNFNSELFDYALWSIDDASLGTSERLKNLVTETMKRMVANQDHHVNEKYRKAGSVPWQGRIAQTCNDDAESLRNMPNMDMSNKEKWMVFRAAERTVTFLPQTEQRELLKRELPALARWLLDWAPPAHCTEGSDVRFGIVSYCHEALVHSANHSNGTSSFPEILTAWLTKFFDEQRGAAYWEGTMTDLRIAMMADSIFTELLRQHRADAMSRALVSAAGRGLFKLDIIDDAAGRVFRIHRDPKKFGKLQTPAPVPQAENSDFEKK